MPSSMILVWIGALFIVCGIVLGAGQVLRKGRLSDPHRMGPGGASATLEPRGSPERGFSMKAHWPAVGLVAIGILLMLAETVV